MNLFLASLIVVINLRQRYLRRSGDIAASARSHRSLPFPRNGRARYVSHQNGGKRFLRENSQGVPIAILREAFRVVRSDGDDGCVKESFRLLLLFFFFFFSFRALSAKDPCLLCRTCDCSGWRWGRVKVAAYLTATGSSSVATAAAEAAHFSGAPGPLPSLLLYRATRRATPISETPWPLGPILGFGTAFVHLFEKAVSLSLSCILAARLPFVGGKNKDRSTTGIWREI